MHQRVSSNGGGSPDPLAPSSPTGFSGSKTGTARATASDVVAMIGGGSHHGEAKFPFESAAADGGV